jgi:hypothetical protein
VKYPSVQLSQGVEVTLTHGRHRAILATNRTSDRLLRIRVSQDLRGVHQQHASLYDAVLQRDLFFRRREDTLDARCRAHGNNIPTAVVGPHLRDQGWHRSAAPPSSAVQAGTAADTIRMTPRFRWWISTASIHTRMC